MMAAPLVEARSAMLFYVDDAAIFFMVLLQRSIKCTRLPLAYPPFGNKRGEKKCFHCWF